ncbi:antirestriction protein ArdA [Actinophytocola sediminis]
MPEIYVASLADYNCGILHGTWVSLDESTDLDDVAAQVARMLAESPAVRRGLSCVAEDYAIHDYEGFDGYKVHEYTSLSRIVAVAAAIAEHGDAFALILNDRGDGSVEESVTDFTDRMCGVWENEGDFAWSEFEELFPDSYQHTASCDWVRFDPEAYVRAHQMDGYEFIDSARGTTVLAPDH